MMAKDPTPALSLQQAVQALQGSNPAPVPVGAWPGYQRAPEMFDTVDQNPVQPDLKALQHLRDKASPGFLSPYNWPAQGPPGTRQDFPAKPGTPERFY